MLFIVVMIEYPLAYLLAVFLVHHKLGRISLALVTQTRVPLSGFGAATPLVAGVLAAAAELVFDAARDELREECKAMAVERLDLDLERVAAHQLDLPPQASRCTDRRALGEAGEHRLVTLGKGLVRVCREVCLDGNMDVALGGRAAEELFLGEENISIGCSSDLDKTTYFGYKYIRDFIMDEDSVVIATEKGIFFCQTFLLGNSETGKLGNWEATQKLPNSLER